MKIPHFLFITLLSVVFLNLKCQDSFHTNETDIFKGYPFLETVPHNTTINLDYITRFGAKKWEQGDFTENAYLIKGTTSIKNTFFSGQRELSLSHSGSSWQAYPSILAVNNYPNRYNLAVSPSRSAGMLDFLFVMAGATVVSILVNPQTKTGEWVTFGAGFFGFMLLDYILFF